jgi:hypothetical protein
MTAVEVIERQFLAPSGRAGPGLQGDRRRPDRSPIYDKRSQFGLGGIN